MENMGRPCLVNHTVYHRGRSWCKQFSCRYYSATCSRDHTRESTSGKINHPSTSFVYLFKTKKIIIIIILNEIRFHYKRQILDEMLWSHVVVRSAAYILLSATRFFPRHIPTALERIDLNKKECKYAHII